MPRARNIKPSFFTNDLLVECPFETRLLFIGLWTLADREGRLQDRPKKIKMDLFPADNIDVDANLNLLQHHNFILRYTVAGERYIEIKNFARHQHPHPAEKASVIPPPSEPNNTEDSYTANKLHGLTMLKQEEVTCLTRSNRAELSTSELSTSDPPLPETGLFPGSGKNEKSGGGGKNILEAKSDDTKSTRAASENLGETKALTDPRLELIRKKVTDEKDFELARAWAQSNAKANWIGYLFAAVTAGRYPWRKPNLKLAKDYETSRKEFRESGWKDRNMPLPSNGLEMDFEEYEIFILSHPAYPSHPGWLLGLEEIRLGSIDPPPGVLAPVAIAHKSCEQIADTIVISQLTKFEEVEGNIKPTGGTHGNEGEGNETGNEVTT